jgi:hypothetical protein
MLGRIGWLPAPPWWRLVWCWLASPFRWEAE